MNKFAMLAAASLSLLTSLSSHAGIVSYFDSSWTDITRTPTSGPIGVNSGDDQEHFSGGFVYPGWGGQAFDAEYIFYRLDGNLLSIGLQTGYDIGDGEQNGYYGGDLALSFNGATPGNAGSYEYAIDFGFETRDYFGSDAVDADNNGDGVDAAGLYRVTGWNNDIYFDGPGGNSTGNNKQSSAPYAMDEGTLELAQGAGLTLLSSGVEATSGSQMSFYRSYQFDLCDLALGDVSMLDAHWTMSCGNDAVDGRIAMEVPEPPMLLLLSTGLFGVMGSFAMRRRKVQR